MDSISSVSSSAYTSAAQSTGAATEAAKSSDVKAGGFSEKAAVYERSTNTGKSVKNSSVDRDKLVAKMQDDLNQRMSQLTDIVRQSIQGQGNALAKSDSIWSYLASGDLKNVDEAAVKQAQEDISENGYWGVDQTSSRIVDFAIALSGGDTDKADKMISAFQKGYEEATKAWGKELPSISSNTYDKVMDKFDQWKNGTYTSSAQA